MTVSDNNTCNSIVTYLSYTAMIPHLELAQKLQTMLSKERQPWLSG